MSNDIQQIINLLKGMSDGQRKRLVTCIHEDAGLLICVGKSKASMLMSISNIEVVISEVHIEFCTELRENQKFSSTFKSLIYRIISPEDDMMDFLDFRMENWPEE